MNKQIKNILNEYREIMKEPHNKKIINDNGKLSSVLSSNNPIRIFYWNTAKILNDDLCVFAFCIVRNNRPQHYLTVYSATENIKPKYFKNEDEITYRTFMSNLKYAGR